MSFNIDETLKSMAEAIGLVLSGEWPKVKDCVKKVLNEEKEAFEAIAKARLDGEIDDDELKSQLDDEQKTMEAVLQVCELKAKVMVQKAANAAMKVFEDAVMAALKVV